MCEDGQQLEAHKVIMASSSPFFEKILQKSKNPHPLIYLRGFQSKDFASILDFLYFGEANVYQEDLDSFLAIAEEIKLKGLTGQTFGDVWEEEEKPEHFGPAEIGKDLFTTSTTTDKREFTTPDIGDALGMPSIELVLQDQSGTDLQALDEKVKSMMEKGQKMIPNGAIQTTSSICKVCGKEGLAHHIRNHIESNHLEGISLPCGYCDKTVKKELAIAQKQIP